MTSGKVRKLTLQRHLFAKPLKLLALCKVRKLLNFLAFDL
jgi:hypothetical protein